MEASCRLVSTPCGFLINSTGSPIALNLTPWNLLGRNPEDHWREAMGCICPPLPEEINTMKPGKSSASEPRPYNTHDPMLGRPAMIIPAFITKCAGSWLICSVVIERTIQRSSATLPISGNNSHISRPDFPNLLNLYCGPKQISFFPCN